MARLSALPTRWEDPILSRAQAEAHLAQPGAVLLAEPEGGHLLGMVVAGGVADILTLYVPEARRRQGVARRLMGEFIGLAKAYGAEGLTLEVAEYNTAAIALYAALGLRVVARRKGYYANGADALVFAIDFT